VTQLVTVTHLLSVQVTLTPNIPKMGVFGTQHLCVSRLLPEALLYAGYYGRVFFSDLMLFIGRQERHLACEAFASEFLG